jgi:hypothetical protein
MYSTSCSTRLNKLSLLRTLTYLNLVAKTSNQSAGTGTCTARLIIVTEFTSLYNYSSQVPGTAAMGNYV